MENYQSYIESGQLEAYAFGELDDAGRAEVEAWAARSPEVRQELAELLDGLGVYAQAHALTPPPALRERVLSRVLAEISGETAATSGAQATASQVLPLSAAAPAAPAPALRVSASNPHNAPVGTVGAGAAAYAAPARRSSWAIAASVALLLSLAANVLFYSRWRQANSELVAVQNSQNRLAQATQVMERRLGGAQQQLQVLRSPDQYRAVALAGTPAHPTARARVFFDRAAHRVFLDAQRLPALPAGRQYQLWAIFQGKPLDAGMLTATTAAGDNLQQMKEVPGAQAFALTVEPVGGSVNPTAGTMTVMGNI